MPDGMLTTVLDVSLGFVTILVGVCAVSVTYGQLTRIEREQFGGPRGEGPGDSSEKPPSNPYADQQPGSVADSRDDRLRTKDTRGAV